MAAAGREGHSPPMRRRLAASTGALLLLHVQIRTPPRHVRLDRGGCEGRLPSLVGRHVWLWGTLLSAAMSPIWRLLGPTETLVPYLVRNQLSGSAAELGLVFASGGVGAILVATVMAQARAAERDHRHVSVRGARPTRRHLAMLVLGGSRPSQRPLAGSGLADALREPVRLRLGACRGEQAERAVHLVERPRVVVRQRRGVSGTKGRDRRTELRDEGDEQRPSHGSVPVGRACRVRAGRSRASRRRPR